MRLIAASLLVLGAGIVLATATPASADAPHDMTNDFHHPLDLQATDPPGPNVAVDGTGDHVVNPGKVLDQARQSGLKQAAQAARSSPTAGMPAIT